MCRPQPNWARWSRGRIPDCCVSQRSQLHTFPARTANADTVSLVVDGADARQAHTGSNPEG